ncbi:MAG: asparagine synthase (glutamine-hydrolyzing) [Planctomycetes bacterium]|nr:asparagine synthase (glutamine-hydrolyzing) [Planctomycetota bacterium]
MCGIAGIFGHQAPGEEFSPLLARMNREMVHRGPDDEGSWMAPEMRTGLAVRRLSIVDLAGGAQPLESEDGSVVLVCNGEIYNHKALRGELQQRGHRFRSASDCEVIVHLYEEDGLAALERLDGMFALALVDRRQRRLLLARDRMGMKPLYYADTAHGLLFASEVKALLASGLIAAEVDRDALGAFFSVGYIPAPSSAFAGIRRLEAGSYLLVENDRRTRGTYWKPRYRRPETVPDERSCAESLEEKLSSAVATHLDADVPVGLFLSGGWDSSLVSVYAAQRARRPLKSFSLVFPDNPKNDESRFSRQVAAQIGSEHVEVEVDLDLLPQILPEVVRALEEPCAAAPFPLVYLLAQAAGREVKVVLGGEGADELFAGYGWLRRRWPYSLRRLVPKALLHPVADRVPHSYWRRVLRMATAPNAQSAHRESLNTCPYSLVRRLLTADLLPPREIDDALEVPSETWASCHDLLDERLSVELTSRLPELLLLINDKMSMAHSLEVRMPMLDASVVDFALGLPSDFKMRGNREKYILSRLTHRLPPEVAGRKKQGLALPHQRLFASDAGASYARQVLLDGNRQQPLFQKGPLERWLKRILAGRMRDSWLLWRLVVLRVWWDGFLSNRSSQIDAPATRVSTIPAVKEEHPHVATATHQFSHRKSA